MPRYKNMRTHGVHPKGRICDEIACGTILSIYNPGPLCHACANERIALVQAAEHREYVRKALAKQRRVRLRTKTRSTGTELAERRRTMVELEAMGLRRVEIARHCDCDPSRVSQILGPKQGVNA